MELSSLTQSHHKPINPNEADHSLSVSGRYTDNSLFENAFTARLAGAYRFSPNVKAHASLGKAIHNPTMSEYYGWGVLG
jgi:vitamin B12 transporter